MAILMAILGHASNGVPFTAAQGAAWANRPVGAVGAVLASAAAKGILHGPCTYTGHPTQTWVRV